VLIAIALAVLGGFFLIVSPLFATSEKPTADLGGVIPATATVGQPFEIDVGFDNTSQSIISPTCVLLDVSGPLQPRSVTFQGTDVRHITNGEACGGSLNGQETVSLRIAMTPTAAGTAQVTVTPAQGPSGIGPGVAGSVTIAAS
jgi:hypothetical protein